MEKVSNPQFGEKDLPLNDEQLRERETWMMEEGNWREDHSVPSVGEHYRYMWKWDSYKAIVINSRRGDPERAETEFFALEKYRDIETGFLSNKIFATTDHKTWRDYPEAWNFNNNKIGTSYSQPPIAAWAATEVYKSFKNNNDDAKALEFLQKSYGTVEDGKYTGLQGEYAYFINHRQNSPDDSLIGIVHPNETGRDSDEANKFWLVNDGKKRYSPPLEWLNMQKFGWDVGRLGRDSQKKRIDWIPEQVREKYWVNDVMFNAMHVSNLRYLADVADILFENYADEKYQKDSARYRDIASSAESQILERMWDAHEGYFYNLDKNGEKIPVDSITGLFALMLENISEEQAAALLDKLEDEKWFATPYPIPTHAAKSEFYDPDPRGFKGAFTPQWSGTVWLDANHFIVEEGLALQAERFADSERPTYNRELAKRALENAGIIVDKSKELLAINPKSMEYYSATNGRGMRVEDFMWSNIGLHFEKFEATKEQLDEF